MARYIDAEELLKREEIIYELTPFGEESVTVVHSYHIVSAPTADVVEVKRGEWIYDHWCEFKCSICGHWSQTVPRGKEKYCPNCGARMKGVE